MRSAILLVLLLPIPGLAAQEAADVLELEVHRTPGTPLVFFKPGEPAEQVVLEISGDDCWLTVRINVMRASIVQYTEHRVRIDRGEFLAAARVAVEKGLLAWEPQGERRLSDWGDVGFRVRTKDASNERAWKGRLRNEDAPRAVFRHLARLAKEKADVPMVYLAE